MAEALSAARIGDLVGPFVAAGRSAAAELRASEVFAGRMAVPPTALDDRASAGRLMEQLAGYLDLLVRWNARTNLTAVRDPEAMVTRHFGESLFAGCVLTALLPAGGTVLDFGSGAGFPGLPIQLLRPDLRMTLAESQGKKSSFLREVVRTLGLATEVFAGRVETMPEGRQFDAVVMRAVDGMERAVAVAAGRVAIRGVLAALGNGSVLRQFNAVSVPLPDRRDSVLEVARGLAEEQSRKNGG